MDRRTRKGGAAIITGAETGIGRATAVALAETHSAIGLTWFRSRHALEEVVRVLDGLGTTTAVEYLDLGDLDAVPGVIERLMDSVGPVSTLVNNAAMPYTSQFVESNLADVRRVLDVNFLGHFIVTQVVARDMVRRGEGGVVINVTSVLQERAKIGSTVYSCAKAALAELTRVIAVELGPLSVRVVAVAPGEIATAMNEQEGLDPATLPRPRTPLRRPGAPEEVARLIRFLASDDASYITGTTVVCDGGLTSVWED